MRTLLLYDTDKILFPKSKQEVNGDYYWYIPYIQLFINKMKDEEKNWFIYESDYGDTITNKKLSLTDNMKITDKGTLLF